MLDTEKNLMKFILNVIVIRFDWYKNQNLLSSYDIIKINIDGSIKSNGTKLNFLG